MPPAYQDWCAWFFGEPDSRKGGQAAPRIDETLQAMPEPA